MKPLTNREPLCAVQDGNVIWYHAIPKNGTLLYAVEQTKKIEELEKLVEILGKLTRTLLSQAEQSRKEIAELTSLFMELNNGRK